MGPQGLIGPTGYQGPLGFQGFQGYQGPQGEIGATGEGTGLFMQNTVFTDGTYGSVGGEREAFHLAFSTIQDAIDAATGGDVIQIQHGEYHETITIPTGKQLTIDFNNSILSGTGTAGPTILVNGVDTELIIKECPTIFSRDHAIQVTDQAILRGDFGNITSDLGSCLLVDNSNVYGNFQDLTSLGGTGAVISLNANSSLQGFFNDITSSAGECLLCEGGSEILNVTTRDLVKDSSSDNTKSCIKIDNSGVQIHFRDISNAVDTPTIYVTNSGSLHGFGRDLTNSDTGSSASVIKLDEDSNAHLIVNDITNDSQKSTIELENPASLNLTSHDITNDATDGPDAAWLRLGGTGPNPSIVKIDANNLSSVSSLRLINPEDSVNQLDLRFVNETIKASSSAGAGPFIQSNNCVKVTGNKISNEAIGGNQRVVQLVETNQPVCYDVNEIVSTNVSEPAFEILGPIGGENGSYVHLTSQRVTGEVVIQNEEFNSPEKGVINVEGAVDAHLHTNLIENIGASGGFALYVGGNEKTRTHLYETIIKSQGVAVALEHDGSTGVADILNNGSRLIMYGSNTILGSTGLGGFTNNFNTDSTTISTIKTSNKGGLINHGRLNLNTAIESSSAKDSAVFEPVSAPEGSQDVNPLYADAHNC